MIKIIVVDDVKIIRDHIIRKICEDPNISIVGEAGSGIEAVKLAQTTEFDILLLDVDMESSVAGIVAAGQILSFNPTAKIIFLTMHEEDEIILSAIESGGLDYVIKSDDVTELLAHIKNAYIDKVHMQPAIRNVVTQEFIRLRKNESNLLYFVRELSNLTPAEKDLIRLLLDNKSVSRIAHERVVEISTVKSQIGHLLKKFNAKRTHEIITHIRKLNLDQLFRD